MKTKIRRHYRSAVSVLLSVCMLISCMTVGLIATDAAQVTGGSEAVGARVEEDEAVGDSLSLQTLNFFFENPKNSNGRSTTLRVLSAAQNQEYELTISSESNYFVEIEVGGTKGSGGDWWLSLYPSLNKNGDYFSDTSKWAESWSDGQSSATKFAPGKYIFKWTEWADQTQDNDYKAKVNFSLTKAPDEHTVQITSSDNYVGTVTGTNSSGAVTIAEGESDKKLTQGSEATISVTVSNGQKADYASVTGISNVPLTYTGSGNTYTGTFTVPNQSTITVSPHLRDKVSYSVVAAANDVSLGTVYPTTAQTVMEDSPVTLTAVPTGNNYFKKWQGTVYSSSDNPATYYVNGADADGSTITITGNFGTNHYTASAGNSLAPANIYAGINATFFDYYYDNEVTNGWLHFSGENNDVNPYKTFNTALSEYAKGNGVKIPLYFGNIYWPKDSNDSGFSAGNGNFLNYTNWFGPPNNVDRLRRDTTHYSSAVGGITDSATHYAVTGLTGTKLSADHKTIYHFDNTATNNTGVPMALFDEDWLTHRDKYTDGGAEKDYSYKGALATIIDSPFPVVKQEYYRLYFTMPSGWGGVNAYFYKNGSPTYGSWPGKTMSCLSGDLYYLDIPKADIGSVKGANVIFSNSSNPGQEGDTTNRKTADVPSDTATTDWYNGSEWSNKGDFTKTIDYYGFNSTGGQDNAYFTGLNNGSPNNLQMQYGAGESYAVKDNQPSGRGCFPFDGEDLRGQNKQAKDYGFGVRMDIPFTLGQGGKINGVNQIFEFSGDDDLWVFIDGELVLDLGGAHGMTTGYIDFGHDTDQAKVVANTAVANVQYPGGDISAVERNHTSASGVFSFTNTGDDVEITKHTMTLYYMERGMGESNLKFGFSFTPVSNEFMTEKKLGTDNVNSALKSDVETAVANDKFNFTNEWSASTSNEDFSKLASGKKYTLIHNGAKSNETTADNNGILPHQNEWFSFGDQTEFIGQFTVGQYFKLEEAAKIGNSAYTYTPSLEVKDLVTGSTIAAESNGAYLFKTTKATTDPTNYNADTDPTRIKATYTNAIATQNVTVTKAIADTTAGDPGAFTISVRVKLPGASDYEAYPLTYATSTGIGTLTVSGGAATATIRKDETITIEGVPVGSSVEVTETNDDGTYSFQSANVTGVDTSANIPNGKTFTVKNGSNAAVTINNSNAPAPTYSVTITKAMYNGYESGDQAFDVKVELDTGSGYTAATKYYDSTDTEQSFASGGIVSLKKGDTITLKSLATGTKVKVTEPTMPAGTTYTYYSCTGSNTFTEPTAVTDVSGVEIGKAFTVGTADGDITLTNHHPVNYYTIQFNYPCYKTLYGTASDPNQTYVVHDVIGADLAEYFDIAADGSTGDLNRETAPNDKVDQLIALMAPHENNFRSDLRYDKTCIETKADGTTWDINWRASTLQKGHYSDGEITFRLTAKTANLGNLTCDFKVPYTMHIDNNTIVVDNDAYNASGTTTDVTPTFMRRYYLDNNASGDNYFWAKDELSGDNDHKYFQYWNIWRKGDEYIDANVIRRCFNPKFNYTFYENYHIEAVYGATKQSSTALSEAYGVNASISFLENSRNQWNMGEGNRVGNVEKPYWQYRGDRVFSDFAISYAYNDLQLKLSSNGDIKTYMVIERLDELPALLEGSAPVQDSHGVNVKDTGEETIKGMIAAVHDDGKAALKDYILSDSAGGRVYIRSEIAKADLDNKNCIEYYYNFANRKQENKTQPDGQIIPYLSDYTTVRNYLFRAYAVITDGTADGTAVSDPAYFTVYDIASIENYHQKYYE